MPREAARVIPRWESTTMHGRHWFKLDRFEDAPPADPPPAEPKPADPPKPGDPAPDPWEHSPGKGGKAQVLADLVAARERARVAEAALQEIADKDKSELEKATEKAAAAEARADAATKETLRIKVAADAGVPAELREFLTADNEADLLAQAEKLKPLAAAPPPPPAPKGPPHDPDGKGPKGTPGPEDMRTADSATVKAALRGHGVRLP